MESLFCCTVLGVLGREYISRTPKENKKQFGLAKFLSEQVVIYWVLTQRQRLGVEFELTELLEVHVPGVSAEAFW